MVAGEGFTEFPREQLAPLGHVSMRRIFGLVTSDAHWFRVDDDNRAVFKAAESVPPLDREKRGRVIDLAF